MGLTVYSTSNHVRSEAKDNANAQGASKKHRASRRGSIHLGRSTLRGAMCAKIISDSGNPRQFPLPQREGKCVVKRSLTNESKIAVLEWGECEPAQYFIFGLLVWASYKLICITYTTKRTLNLTFNDSRLYAEWHVSIICTSKIRVQVLRDGESNACKYGTYISFVS